MDRVLKAAIILKSLYQIEGRIYSKLTGRQITHRAEPASYPQVNFTDHTGTRRVFREHEVLFALWHGYLPDRVDHHNGDIRENTRKNLRASNASLNGANRAARGYSQKRPGKWRAYVTVAGKQQSLGTYGSEEEAAQAAKEGRIRVFGDHAYARR